MFFHLAEDIFLDLRIDFSVCLELYKATTVMLNGMEERDSFERLCGSENVIFVVCFMRFKDKPILGLVKIRWLFFWECLARPAFS